MRGLRLCCKGIEDNKNVELEPEPKDNFTFPNKTKSYNRPKEASVIPPKRKCVKKMMCTCFIDCIFHKDNTHTKTKAVYGAVIDFILISVFNK
ncbi:hypothetical protein CR513_56857, partial [Mucuna pruriens]